MQGALVRHAMQSLPLSNLVQEIKDINVFLSDLENDTHQVGQLRGLVMS